MDNYKLVNGDEVRRKAFRLGYTEPINMEFVFCPFIFLSDDKKMHFSLHADYYYNSDFTEITQKDFLALPEPLNVGDWVKSITSSKENIIIIGRVYNCFMDEVGINVERGAIVTAKYKNCTKLTPKQIEILGLEY